MIEQKNEDETRRGRMGIRVGWARGSNVFSQNPDVKGKSKHQSAHDLLATDVDGSLFIGSGGFNPFFSPPQTSRERQSIMKNRSNRR